MGGGKYQSMYNAHEIAIREIDSRRQEALNDDALGLAWLSTSCCAVRNAAFMDQSSVSLRYMVLSKEVILELMTSRSTNDERVQGAAEVKLCEHAELAKANEFVRLA